MRQGVHEYKNLDHFKTPTLRIPQHPCKFHFWPSNLGGLEIIAY